MCIFLFKGLEGFDMILVEIFEIRKNNLISFKMKKIINIIYMYIVLDFFFEVRSKLL